MNRRSTSVAANPVLIGAATVLVVIVAVFLAYNANNGLPFVPTYQLWVQLPNASNLVTGNEVRIGGDRVGIIDQIQPLRHKDGSVSARLHVKLQTDVKPLPVDSTIIVRPRSPLGLKYIEVTRGSSSRGIAEGGTLPLRNATPRPVEFDDFFNMFNAPTRAANQVNLREFGDALAGRGTSINEAIVALDPLTKNAIPVLRNLADPATGLGRFFRALEQTSAAVAPVAEQQGQLFRNLATTFDAFAAISVPYLQDTISGGPAALDTAIRSFPIQRPLLANAAGFFRDLQPGAAALRTSGPLLAEAFSVGTTQVRRAAALNDQLTLTLRSLQDFAQDPQVALGLHGLHRTVDVLTPTVNHLAGAQTNCNYLALLLNNVASLESDGDTAHQGTWVRVAAVSPPIGPNSEVGPASAPANADATAGVRSSNHLHANPYPLVGAKGQGGICMAGNEVYVNGQTVIGNPPGRAPRTTARVPKALNGF
ncbi:MAG TPA: MlaD family protein [Conexibacter sp.]|jgi:virulence factor Mce-like protein|nr:MlaD family protein [Conexibacter sp.]